MQTKSPATSPDGIIQATNIEARLAVVKARIAKACADHQRDQAEVKLLAVSKTKPAELVSALLPLGQRDFGENYLQDAMAKIEVLGNEPSWHFIGAIQSNKTRDIAEHFSWVHTVASLKVARRLSDQRPANKPPLKVFLQINIDDDPNKTGFAAAELGAVLDDIRRFPNLHLQGLMTLPREREGFEAQRAPFRALRQLQLQHCPEHKELSMGMSGDLEAAIAEGATWVRIGTDIFGARQTT